MVKETIAQVAVITVILFFAGEMFRRLPLFRSLASIGGRLAIGLLSGASGMIVMFFGVQIPPNSLFDLRQLFVLIAAWFGGIYASVTAGAVIGIARVLLSGGLNESSGRAVVSLLVIGVVAGLLFKNKRKDRYWLQWSIALLCVMVTIATSTLSLLPFEDAVKVGYFILPMFFCGGLYVAYMVKHLMRSNELMLQHEKEATTDYLTGLHNVRSFDRLFNKLAQESTEKQQRLGVLLVDIDFFKKINDLYGHIAGDKVLKEVAAALRSSARSFDIVSRNGGEEFALLLPECPPNYAEITADSIRRQIERHAFSISDQETIRLTVSIGIATYPELPIDELIDNADQALYEAKRLGRNRLCVRPPRA